MTATLRAVPWGHAVELPKVEASSEAEAQRYQIEIKIPFDVEGKSPDELRDQVLTCRRKVRDALDPMLARILRLADHDPASYCKRELAGAIDDVPLLDLMQIIKMGRRSAVIDVRREECVGRLWCSDGELVDAAIGNLEGEAAAYRILGMDEGDLFADYRTVARPRLIRETMHTLVLEAARRKDECDELLRRLGGREAIWWSAPSTAGVLMDDVEASVFEAVAQGSRVRTVLARNRVGDYETLRAMADLAERNCIRSYLPQRAFQSTNPPPPAEPTPPPPLPQKEATQARKYPWAPAVAAAVALTAVLGAVATTAGGDSVEVDGDARDASVSESGESQAQPSERYSYPVRVSVAPPEADLWLDGRLAATGQLAVALARDGQTHELLILANGYQSKTFLFQDISPPELVALEPMTKAAGSRGHQDGTSVTLFAARQ